MSRRYKRKSKDSDTLGDIAGILVLLGLAVGFTKIREINENSPHLMPFVIAGAVLLVGLVIGLAIRKYIRDIKVRRAFTMSDIDSMDGVAFEYYLADLLRDRGYTNVKVTEKFDLGVDIIAERDGITWGIQAKRYKSMVKVEAVRQAYTALAHYKCDRAMVVSNSSYSRPAVTLAQETNTVLVGRELLAEWVYEVSNKS